MKCDAPIGVFDSGLGGLTVARRIMERLSHESITYVGDEIHVPYGERSADEIRGFALGITEFLIGRKAKLVVMACNMSSATALPLARDRFPGVPIIGVIEAGVRAAARITGGGPIGVLATTGTVKSGAYTREFERLLPAAVVIEQACPKFVPLVEAGDWNSQDAEEAIREYTDPLLSAGCRTLVLGCTHYPFLSETISRVAGQGVTLIDPADETAEEAARILADAELLNAPHAEPAYCYCTTDLPESFSDLGSRFLGRDIFDVQRIAWGVELGVPCRI